MLTILPKDLAIKILIARRAIRIPDNYIVTKWPDMAALPSKFAEAGLDATMHEQSLGYWGARTIRTPDTVQDVKDRIREDTEEKLYPHLEKVDREIVDQTFAEYCDGLDKTMASGAPREQLLYLKPTWDITVAKA